jgi:SAM-dependent methyltransferase
MRSNAEWTVLGKQALALKPADKPFADEEFYALGDEWLDYATAWQGSIGYCTGTVLEIGCDPGRITKRLAAEFDRVIAIDISADWIAYAKARVTAGNITWQEGSGESLPAADGVADAVFSCLVFQHFPDNASQLRLFPEISRVLKPGGTFFIHIPMHLFPIGRFSSVVRRAYSAFCLLRDLKMSIAVQLMRLGGRPPMRGVSYEMDKLIAEISKLGFAGVGTTIVKTKRGQLHSCIYGRKI